METEFQPAGFTDVRATNLAVVLRHLRANGPSSRAAIAASTGLNKATVSSLTSDLIDQRLLRETGQSGNRIGRPGTALAIDGSAFAAIGLQVTPDRLSALAVDFAGERLLLWHRVPDGVAAGDSKAAAGAGPSIVALVQRAAGRVRRQGRHVTGLTVAVPGPLLDSPGLDLRALLAGSLRQPDLIITVESHATLAALAEQRHGSRPGAANLAYITAAAGIEAGLVVDGRALRGTRGRTGRIGRLLLTSASGDDVPLQELAGLESLLRGALPGTDPASLADLSPSVEHVATLARSGDAGALAALQEAGHHLGRGLSLLANLVDPEIMVLGDHYATLADWLIPAAAAELGRTGLSHVELTASKLGLHAAALGGALSHLDRVDTGTLGYR